MNATGTNTNAGLKLEPPPPQAPPAAGDDGGVAEGTAAVAEKAPAVPDHENGAVNKVTTPAKDAATQALKTPPPGRGCVAPGCLKYRKSRTNGYCLACYKESGGIWPPLEELPGRSDSVNRDGSEKNPPPGRGCVAPGCRKYSKSRCGGYCLACFRERGPGGECVSIQHVGAAVKSENGGKSDSGIAERVAEELPALHHDHAPLPTLDATPPLPAASPFARPVTSSAAKPAKFCQYGDCPKLRQSNCHGYCLTHVKLVDVPPPVDPYRRRIRKTDVSKAHLCKWAGCDKYVQSNCRGYCLTHVKLANYEDDDGVNVTKVRVRVENRLRNGFVRAVLPEELRVKWGFGMGGGEGGDGEGEEENPTLEGGEEEGIGDGEIGGGDDEPQAEASTDVQEALLHAAVEGEGEGDDEEKPAAMDVDAAALTVGGGEKSELPTSENKPDIVKSGEPQPKQEQTPPEEEEKKEDEGPPDLSKLDFSIAATSSRKPNGATRCKAIEKDGTICDKNSQGARFAGFCRVHHTRYLIGLGQVETWVCEPCNKTMTELQTRCGKCHRWRGGSQIEAMTTVARKKGLLHAGEQFKRAKPRTMEEVRRSMDSGEGSEVGDNDDGLTRTRGGMLGPWECLRCGIANPGQKKRCGGCLTYRGMGARGSSSKPKATSAGSRGDLSVGTEGAFAMVETLNLNWACGRCTFLNFPAELECYSCGVRRSNYEWHKRQKLLGASSGGDEEGEEASTAGEEVAAANANPVGQAKPPPEPATQSTTNPSGATAPTGDESLNYYGTCDEGAPYHHISLHYDFNQSYYRNCEYRYLNEGIGALPLTRKLSKEGCSASFP